jgi:SMC interacting uncharacterized protein involved in chromosome segregation
MIQAMVSENAANSAEVDHMENEIQRIRMEATTGLLQSQQRAQKVTME